MEKSILLYACIVQTSVNRVQQLRFFFRWIITTLRLTSRTLNARKSDITRRRDTLRRSRASREIDYRSSLSRGRETSRDRPVDVIRVDVMKTKMHDEWESKREREAYLLSGGRLYSGDNDIVVAPIGNVVGDHGRRSGFIAHRMLHPMTTYHRRRSGLRDRLEEATFRNSILWFGIIIRSQRSESRSRCKMREE